MGKLIGTATVIAVFVSVAVVALGLLGDPAPRPVYYWRE